MKTLKFMPFYMAGYPSIDESIETIKMLEKYADIIEIGIPFSDPSADGKIIQEASEVAIENGFETSDFFEILKAVNTTKPIVILCYLNTIIQYGIEKFMQDCSKYSVMAILCPDLPPEHRNLLSNNYKIDITHIVSTNTPTERVKYIDSLVNSFLYFVSKPSITGVKSIIEQSTLDYIEKIKPIIKNQLFIGFGISDKNHVEQLKKTSIDGFIIGSKIISLKQNEIEVYLNDLFI